MDTETPPPDEPVAEDVLARLAVQALREAPDDTPEGQMRRVIQQLEAENTQLRTADADFLDDLPEGFAEQLRKVMEADPSKTPLGHMRDVLKRYAAEHREFAKWREEIVELREERAARELADQQQARLDAIASAVPEHLVALVDRVHDDDDVSPEAIRETLRTFNIGTDLMVTPEEREAASRRRQQQERRRDAMSAGVPPPAGPPDLDAQIAAATAARDFETSVLLSQLKVNKAARREGLF